MRVSADAADSGYRPDLIGRVRIWLDDVEVTNRCVTADDERGEAVLHVLDAEGRPTLDRARNAVRTETISGAVSIEVLNGHA